MTQRKGSVLHHIDEEEHKIFPREVGMAPSTTGQRPTASPEPG